MVPISAYPGSSGGLACTGGGALAGTEGLDLGAVAACAHPTPMPVLGPRRVDVVRAIWFRVTNGRNRPNCGKRPRCPLTTDHTSAQPTCRKTHAFAVM